MKPNPSVIRAVTPTGKLRASINLGNPILVGKDGSGGPAGVSVDLARAFAATLGVELELVVFDAAGKSVEVVKRPLLTFLRRKTYAETYAGANQNSSIN
ncbi:hypothetical protein ATN79_47890 [Paraburkholderia caribensis]|nr:hypothetical protein ATN79_47890 [Paraburkholderia caribensis]